MGWVGFDSGVWLLVVMVSRWLGLVCFCLDDWFFGVCAVLLVVVFVLCCVAGDLRVLWWFGI